MRRMMARARAGRCWVTSGRDAGAHDCTHGGDSCVTQYFTLGVNAANLCQKRVIAEPCLLLINLARLKLSINLEAQFVIKTTSKAFAVRVVFADCVLALEHGHLCRRGRWNIYRARRMRSFFASRFGAVE